MLKYVNISVAYQHSCPKSNLNQNKSHKGILVILMLIKEFIYKTGFQV
ncbi:hypothetical protein HanPSC8_Chr17g0772431 [Helianthus annuus]|nr:hypothetical protein HanPSC8_Chr17g0772431 [Helianthus annuus]